MQAQREGARKRSTSSVFYTTLSYCSLFCALFAKDHCKDAGMRLESFLENHFGCKNRSTCRSQTHFTDITQFVTVHQTDKFKTVVLKEEAYVCAYQALCAE